SDVLANLQSSSNGLSGREAATRLARDGQNVIATAQPISFWKLFLEQFRNYIIWLLIAIALFAYTTGFLLRKDDQLVNAAIISFIVLFNAAIGAYQDYKAEKAAELLQQLLATKTRVRRDGAELVIDASDLVLGDIVLLAEGDKVPADC